MNVEIREDSVFISGYVNAVERLSKQITEKRSGGWVTFFERIKAGVFRTALKRNDNVLVLLNHDMERVLASTKREDAVLEEDNIGLKAEITIRDKEVVEKARSGRLSGWSFGFIANEDEMSAEGGRSIRTVTDMDLIEVSILDDTKTPAYYGTSIEAREGGAKVVEIRADAFTTEEQTEDVTEDQTEEQTEGKPTISIDELASLVAAKVIEALKVESKAEETTEEQTEGTETQTEEEAEAVTEETTEDEPEAENRNIDYSAFEERLAKLKK